MTTKKNPNKSLSRVSVQLIERRIYLIRKHKVMIDVDLADLYEVPTKRLNEQVRRNRKRFPKDFMFRLTKTEAEALRSQFATSKTDWFQPAKPGDSIEPGVERSGTPGTGS